MTPPELDEARALLAGITPGEWRADTSEMLPSVYSGLAWICEIPCDGLTNNLDDLAFIARAPALLRWAVARIDALETMLDIAERALHDINCAPEGYDATQRSYEAVTAIQAALGADAGDDEAR